MFTYASVLDKVTPEGSERRGRGGRGWGEVEALRSVEGPIKLVLLIFVLVGKKKLSTQVLVTTFSGQKVHSATIIPQQRETTLLSRVGRCLTEARS